MVSFLDRPHDRVRDLADIAWIMHMHLPDMDDRRFDVRFVALDVGYDEAPAFALGEDLRAMAGCQVPLVERFIATVEGAWLDVLVARGPRRWAHDAAEAGRQLRALRLGVRGPAE